MLKNQSAVYRRDCNCITDFSLSKGLLGKSGIIFGADEMGNYRGRQCRMSE